MSEITLGELLDRTLVVQLEAYDSQMVSSRTLALTISMEEEVIIGERSYTDRHFHVHLDVSKRFGFSEIDVINLTPKKTEGYIFFSWLEESLGKKFINSYCEKLYDDAIKEHGALVCDM